MATLYDDTLRARLRERRARLVEVSPEIFENELRVFVRWLEQEPRLAGVLQELEAQPLDFEAWARTAAAGRRLPLPEDERQRALISLEVCRSDRIRQFARLVAPGATKYVELNRAFVETWVDLLVAYLADRLRDGGFVLGALARYTRRTEWFRAEAILERCRADSARAERVVDADLREYLHDQGVPFPFAQAVSPSGRADVVAGLDGDEPLALEIKLYDPADGKGEGYLRQGFAQAFRYAADFGLPVGYLVAFNLTAKTLMFEGDDDTDGWPPAIRIGGRTIFALAVQLNPERPTASRDRRLDRDVVTADDLRAAVPAA